MSSGKEPQKKLESELIALRLLQLVFLALFIWFLGWTPFYDIAVQSKTLSSSIYDNFGNFLTWLISITAVVFLQILVLKRRHAPTTTTTVATHERNKPWPRKPIPTNRMIPLAMLVFGAMALLVSTLYASSILAFVGLGLAFWGALLLYITPSKTVPLEFLNAIASSTLLNIEKTIATKGPAGRAVYLPPKYLKDFESSLVFIPQKVEQSLPKPEEISEEKIYSGNPDGIFLTPPGLGLSKLFEKELGTSFTRTDLKYLEEKLPKLFIEEMEIAENMEVRTEGDTVMVVVTKHIFKDNCEETKKLPKTHRAVGCLLSSAVACALAKATGKMVTIETEEQSPDGETTKVRYRLLEEK